MGWFESDAIAIFSRCTQADAVVGAFFAAQA